VSEQPGKIYGQISKVMAGVSAIGRDRTNTQQNYKFRGIDDVYNALNHVLAEHCVFTVPTVLEERTEDRPSRSGGALIYRVLKIQYRFYADDGSFVESVVIGEGMDSGDKASNKAMAVAHKYALLQVFAIPTEEPKDPENESPQVADKKPASSSQRKYQRRQVTPPAEPVTVSLITPKVKRQLNEAYKAFDTLFGAGMAARWMPKKCAGVLKSADLTDDAAKQFANWMELAVEVQSLSVKYDKENGAKATAKYLQSEMNVAGLLELDLAQLSALQRFLLDGAKRIVVDIPLDAPEEDE
jgi:ERF superfamily